MTVALLKTEIKPIKQGGVVIIIVIKMPFCEFLVSIEGAHNISLACKNLPHNASKLNKSIKVMTAL